MMEKEKFNRFVALKIKIRSINQGKFVSAGENEPNYLLSENQKLYRMNVVAAVVGKEKQGSITNIILDDGSGRIVVRLFEESDLLNSVEVGKVVIVIGKVREYNQEKYLSAEIIRPVNPAWLKVRSLEIPKKQTEVVAETPTNKEEIKEIEEEMELPLQKINKIIKDLDEGDGVPIEEVIAKSPLEETESLIQKMLESGEIFQNQPGKIKVL